MSHLIINLERLPTVGILWFESSKTQENRTILTAGGDRIKYPGDCGKSTDNLLTVKLLHTSLISTIGENVVMLDKKITLKYY